MKLLNLLSKFSLIIISAVAVTPSYSAELDKSSLTSNHSSIDIKNNTIVYSDNVIYQHGGMEIKADLLTRSEQGVIHVSGTPVKIHYIDPVGQASDISANEFDYQEQSGALNSQGNIKIIQRSQKDTLILEGTNLEANKKASQGFSFILTGAPTHFRIQQPGQEDIFVIADQLRSNGKDKQTQLLGNVKLTQGTSSTAAPLLTYDGQTGMISAHQDASGEQRVETEFFWQKDPESSDSTENEHEQESKEGAGKESKQEPSAKNEGSL